MIEQILKRIAQRGANLSDSAETDRWPVSAGAARSSLPFPASLPAGQASGKDQLASQLAVWEQTKDEYYANHRQFLRDDDLPPAYANYSMVHALIGGLIWSERKHIRNNIVHVVNGRGDVVAAIYPSDRTVAIRRNISSQGMGLLSLKELPATAAPFDTETARLFENTTVHMLLWYVGQVMPEAVENIPNELIKGKMLLRKLPLVLPSALDLRHLQLIHIFSAGSINLQTLLTYLTPEAQRSICADLTSLYLTGCLVSHE